ncbi:pseudouridylate synthase RPUSD2-like [Physella acuta]|uniref:pseudouridylate synthase RPUSD2-like n=1 Tax=Physella acuta TaxID=109671 RepID=UPI0027DE25BA|nr:pseudouridylate synthase RPUSD2-like [Physella acuta]
MLIIHNALKLLQRIGYKGIPNHSCCKLKHSTDLFTKETFLPLNYLNQFCKISTTSSSEATMAECALPKTDISPAEVEVDETKMNITDNLDASKPLSKNAMKKMARAQKHSELKKQRREEMRLNQKDDAGYSPEDLKDSSYYFENGLRKVYPYTYIFATHAKGRWVGRTLLEVLEKEFGYDQPGDLEKAFESGMIHVNNNRVPSDYRLKDCDFISHKTHRHENPVTAAPIEIIENSEDLLVVNKPSSIPCHPCGRYRFNSLVFILGKEMGLVNLRNIYRLDRLTSGILILGKSIEKTRVLMNQIAKRQVQKEYVCRVVGKFPEGTVTVDQPLMPLSNKLRLQVVSPKGKSSQTTFTRLSYNNKTSVVRCVPHTGRTHQIRVHLQYLGHPIINDMFYNSEAWGPNKGKGGVYELNFDEVCQRILSEHHVTLWDGGENPLYEEKLKEMQSLAAVDDLTNTKCIEQIQQVPREQISESPVCVESHTDGQKNSDNFLCHEPPIKRLKTETVQSDPGGETADGATSPPEATQPGFDMARWSVDPACDLCKKKPVDPGEKNLVIFLHALRYKGPGWEYETSLPEWAKEDWNREDDYIIDTCPKL